MLFNLKDIDEYMRKVRSNKKSFLDYALVLINKEFRSDILK